MLARVLLIAVACGAPASSQTAPYEYDLKESVAPGVSYRERRWMRGGDGPFTMQILEVDPAHRAVNLLPVRAREAAIGKETVSSMARRYGATAAVNGGYFVVPGIYAGASAGAYLLDGEILSIGAGRSAMLLCTETGFREHAEIDVVNGCGSVRAANGESISIDGVNRQRGAQELVLYRPSMGAGTLTEAGGVEVALDGAGRVLRIDDHGNAAIPPGGAVLSGAGAAAEWLRRNAATGSVLTVDLQFNPAATSNCRPQDIVGAGPRLVRGGKADVTEEQFGHQRARHPRTAFALASRGTFLFVTLDGRQSRSTGMKLDEFAAELIALGAAEAINLDGGGSTTMVVDGVVRNSPSDGFERAVSDALLVFSVNDPERLSLVLDRLAADERQIEASVARALAGRIRANDLESAAAMVESERGRGISQSAASVLAEAIDSVRR